MTNEELYKLFKKWFTKNYGYHHDFDYNCVAEAFLAGWQAAREYYSEKRNKFYDLL